jgi:hypothetical protein
LRKSENLAESPKLAFFLRRDRNFGRSQAAAYTISLKFAFSLGAAIIGGTEYKYSSLAK